MLGAWWAIAGLGALHGLSPANGWMFAATCCGANAREGAQVRHALLPIAIGHAAAIALVAGAMAHGIWMDRTFARHLAGALLVGVATYRGLHSWGARGTFDRIASGDNVARAGAAARHVGIALWSCLVAIAHGAGMMLVPALMPLCQDDAPARALSAAGPLVLVAAAGVHLTAMLAMTGVIATGLSRGLSRHPRLRQGAVLRHGGTIALALMGVVLLVHR